MALRFSAAWSLGLFLLLSCSYISLASAHGTEADEQHGSNSQTNGEIQSYFALRNSTSILYLHITLMTVAYVAILPVGKESAYNEPLIAFLTCDGFTKQLLCCQL